MTCLHLFSVRNRKCIYCGMPHRYLQCTYEQKEELAVEHLISKLSDLGEDNGLGNTSEKMCQKKFRKFIPQ